MTTLDISGRVDPAFLAGLRSVGEGMGTVAEKTRAASAEAESSVNRMRRLADAFNEMHTMLSTVVGTVSRFVTATAELTAEQSHLDDMSARLGLNFDQAAGAAGRFVDEVDVMNTAGAFAARGIHLTQVELNAMTHAAARMAQQTGVETSQALNTLEEALVRGRERGLAPFGAEISATAAHGYTLTEGLAALVAQEGHMESATDDARTSAAGLSDSFGDVARGAATFAANIIGLPSILADVSHAAGELATDLAEINRLEREQESRTAEGGARARALSEFATAQHTSGQIADRLGAARTGIAVANINGMTTAQIVAMTQRIGSVNTRLATTGQPTDLAGAALGALRPASGSRVVLDTRVGGSDPFLANATRSEEELQRASHGTVISVTADRAELLAVYREAGQALATERTAEAARVRAAAEAERLARRHGTEDADGAGGGRGGGRGGETAAQRAQAAMASQAGAVRMVAAMEADAIERRVALMARNVAITDAMIAYGATATAAANDNEILQSDKADALADKERRRLDSLREAHESYTGRLAELNEDRVHGSQLAAEFTNDAFGLMGKALASHTQAFVDGRESIGVALQGMLADTLKSVGQEAIVKGAMEIAHGVAALAGIYTAPLAPGHFAAGAAYMGVGALASIAGAALTPAPSAPSAGAGNGGAAGHLSDRTSGGSDAMAPININYYAPVIGGRESADYEVAQRLSRYDDAGRARMQRAA